MMKKIVNIILMKMINKSETDADDSKSETDADDSKSETDAANSKSDADGENFQNNVGGGLHSKNEGQDQNAIDRDIEENGENNKNINHIEFHK